MRLKQYIELIQKSFDIKASSEIILLLPFKNQKFIPAEIISEIKSLPSTLDEIHKEISSMFNHEFSILIALYFLYIQKNDFESYFHLV